MAKDKGASSPKKRKPREKADSATETWHNEHDAENDDEKNR